MESLLLYHFKFVYLYLTLAHIFIEDMVDKFKFTMIMVQYLILCMLFIDVL